jgi:hypothetical protein
MLSNAVLSNSLLKPTSNKKQGRGKSVNLTFRTLRQIRGLHIRVGKAKTNWDQGRAQKCPWEPWHLDREDKNCPNQAHQQDTLGTRAASTSVRTSGKGGGGGRCPESSESKCPFYNQGLPGRTGTCRVSSGPWMRWGCSLRSLWPVMQGTEGNNTPEKMCPEASRFT